jgi:fumarate hydratase class I
MAQILINSRMCAEGHRPICQDTGIVTVFSRSACTLRWDGDDERHDMVNEGVRRAYNHPDNLLRASVLADPAGARKNTKDNTPAVVHTEIVPGDNVEVIVAAKGGGSENKSKLAMLNPSDDRRLGAEDRADHGRRLVPAGHARHRHRRHRREGDAAGQGVADGAIDIQELIARGPRTAPRNCAWSSSRRSMPWASAPRAWAASPPCSTSRSWTTRPTPPPAGGDDPQLRRHPPRALRARRLGPGRS